jgi:hypothetical protein
MVNIEVKGLGRLQNIQRNLKQVVTPAGDIIDYGFPVAQDSAPKLTGATRRALQKIKFNDEYAILRLRQPRQSRADPRPYHLWMHGIGQYDISSIIKSGNAKFMFFTADKMAGYINEQTKIRLNNLNK